MWIQVHRSKLKWVQASPSASEWVQVSPLLGLMAHVWGPGPKVVYSKGPTNQNLDFFGIPFWTRFLFFWGNRDIVSKSLGRNSTKNTILKSWEYQVSNCEGISVWRCVWRAISNERLRRKSLNCAKNNAFGENPYAEIRNICTFGLFFARWPLFFFIFWFYVFCLTTKLQFMHWKANFHAELWELGAPGAETLFVRLSAFENGTCVHVWLQEGFLRSISNRLLKSAPWAKNQRFLQNSRVQRRSDESLPRRRCFLRR